jgi:two-component system LytT family response regulator
MKTPAYKALVVDDEANAREMLVLLLESSFPRIQEIKRAASIKEASIILKNWSPDLLFLDIQLGDGRGLDIPAMFPGLEAKTIFVTAYDQYAISAIRAAAFDYLLKPLNEGEFKAAVTKALEQIQVQRLSAENQGVSASLSESGKIGLPDLTGLRVVTIASILHCQAEDNYTKVFFRDGSSVLVSYTLARLESKLKSAAFIRIHHKYLVNLEGIEGYLKGKGGGKVQLVGNTILPVSARKKVELMKHLLV